MRDKARGRYGGERVGVRVGKRVRVRVLILFRGMGVRLRGNDNGDGGGNGKKAYVIERAKGRRKKLFV